MNRKITLAVGGVLGGVLVLAAAPAAMAQQGGYAYANVIDVQPIVRTVRIEQPRRECWTEEVTRYERRHNAAGPMIAGGIIGGVLGNQIGKGNGRRAATAAGVLIGSSIGHDKAPTEVRPRTRVEQHCTVQREFYEEERIDGYRVTYEYGGAAYVTRMRHHPGNQVRVQVSVRPVGF